METIKNALGMGSNNQEPVSGRTGNTSAGEPYDAGNISSTDTQRVGGSDLGSTHVGAVSQSQGALGGTGDARRTAPGGDNSSSHVGAASSSLSSGVGHRSPGDATHTAPAGDNSSSHVGAISSSSGSGLAQPSERDAARAAGTDRMTSGPSSTQQSQVSTPHSHTATSQSQTMGSSNIGPIGDGRGTSSSTGLGSSTSHSHTGGVGPVSDGRNTSSNIGLSNTGSSTSGSNYSSSVIPGTSGAPIGASSGFLPVRSGDSSVLGDDNGMSRSSQPTTGIQTAQRDSGFSSGSTGSSLHHTGPTLGQSSDNISSRGTTGSEYNSSSTTSGQNVGAHSTGGVGSAVAGETTRGHTTSDASHSTSHSNAKHDNLEESKKHASPAVAQILEEADQKVKEKGLRKLGPNESSDPEAAKDFEMEAAHTGEHHEKAGMAAKVKGALHMGGKH